MEQKISSKQQASGDWNSTSFSSNFTNYNGIADNAPKYRIAGTQGILKGYASPVSSILTTLNNGSQSHLMFTIPESVRPPEGLWNLQQGSGSDRWFFSVQSDGQVLCSRYSGTATTSTWLPFYIEYSII